MTNGTFKEVLTHCPFDEATRCSQMANYLVLACESSDQAHESDGSVPRIARLMVSAAGAVKAKPCSECASPKAEPELHLSAVQ